jgi:hypothetical protein
VSLLGNQYYGSDTPDNPGRRRFHTDDSIQVRDLDRPDRCETGGGAVCRGGTCGAVPILSGFHGLPSGPDGTGSP